MEKRNKIELTERFRQTGATREIVAKFFGDKDSCLIVQNQMMKDVLIINHLNTNLSNLTELSNRVLIFGRGIGPDSFEEILAKHETWYLDVCTENATKIIIGLALDMNKTLIGHYGGKELPNENQN